MTLKMEVRLISSIAVFHYAVANTKKTKSCLSLLNLPQYFIGTEWGSVVKIRTSSVSSYKYDFRPKLHHTRFN